MGNSLRKILVVMIMLIPAISYSGCKKQPKCGCDGDVLNTITDFVLDHSSIIYGTGGTTAYFTEANGIGYDTYYFCNPGEMYANYTAIPGTVQVKISGDFYWDCTYVQNISNSSSSSSSIYSYYKIYQIKITSLAASHSIYGKK